jgi:hypothetical protein
VETDRALKTAAFAVWAGLLLACAGVGCSAEGPKVGQSGSEGVPDPGGGGGSTVQCPCGVPLGLAPNALRVSVLAQEGDSLSLRIEEILNGTLPLVPGDVIEASRYDDTFACSLGCAPLDVGDQAFAFYYVSGEPALPPCVARAACVAACDAENAANEAEPWRSSCACRQPPAPTQSSVSESPTCGVDVFDSGRDCKEECEQETAESCPPRPDQDYKRGTVGLSPWADPIVFARTELGEVSVPIAELPQLWNDDGTNFMTCHARFGDWSDVLTEADWSDLVDRATSSARD